MPAYKYFLLPLEAAILRHYCVRLAHRPGLHCFLSPPVHTLKKRLINYDVIKHVCDWIHSVYSGGTTSILLTLWLMKLGVPMHHSQVLPNNPYSQPNQPYLVLLFFLPPFFLLCYPIRLFLEVQYPISGYDWAHSLHRLFPSWGFPGLSTAVMQMPGDLCTTLSEQNLIGVFTS